MRNFKAQITKFIPKFFRPLTADGHYHGHSHKPSMDTLRRVHFEKAATPSSNGGGTLTPASPPKIKVVKTFLIVRIRVESNLSKN